MDAFFASVELLAHPEWRGKPLVVGSMPDERGVVSTCSYEARRYGVRSAMPSATAYALCPHAIFTHPHMPAYKAASEKVFEVFGHYTPYVEAVSVDEAFLDVTGSLHLFGGSARTLGERLRAEVRGKCGVTCSVGIAPNRLLAKMGSELNKPDGLTVMPFDRDEIVRFMAPRPVSAIWGVGAKTAEVLKPYGIATCGDVQRTPLAHLVRILGHAAAQSLADGARGASSDIVHWEEASEKSVSREHTFNADEPMREAVRAKLLELVAEVGRRFRREKRWAGTARLKLRTADFATITRQTPFPAPSRDDIAFRRKALELFDAAWPENVPTRNGRKAVRLVGFGVSGITESDDDCSAGLLFGDEAAAKRRKRERLSEALDALARLGSRPRR